MPPVRGLFVSGQPLDHEPNLGQVPIVPPGTPPGGDSWGVSPHHHFGGRLQPPPSGPGSTPRGYLPPGPPPGHQSPCHQLQSAAAMAMQAAAAAAAAAAGNTRLGPPSYQDVSDGETGGGGGAGYPGGPITGNTAGGYGPVQPVTSQHSHVEVY